MESADSNIDRAGILIDKEIRSYNDELEHWQKLIDSNADLTGRARMAKFKDDFDEAMKLID